MPSSVSLEAPLRAGAGEADITPAMGTQLGGDIGRRRPAEMLLDRLYARAVVLEGHGKRLCVVSTDLLAISDTWADEIRQRAGEMFGLDPRTVMLHCTQTHAAPSVGHLACSDKCQAIPQSLSWLRGGDDRYNDDAVRGILEAIRLAVGSLDPVRVGVGSGVEARIAFNRRFIMRDGTSRCHPGVADLPNILQVEGPMDPEVGLICLTTKELRPVASILHYTCHPTHGYPHRFVTADWPGEWVKGFRAVCAGEGVPLVLNGCCGNIHHCNHLDPSYTSSAERMGRCLTETTEGIYRHLRFRDDAVLDWHSEHVKVPLRESTPKELDWARNLLREHPEPMWSDESQTSVAWDWVYAVSLLDVAEQRARQPEFDYEVQVLRVGDVALVGLSGEPFVELQLRIKLESPVRHTYIGHMCNGSAGYIPTRRAFEGGGYETRTCNWSKLAPEALEIIEKAAVGMLKEMFAK